MCNTHPRIRLTMEFNNFHMIESPCWFYNGWIWAKWYREHRRDFRNFHPAPPYVVTPRAQGFVRSYLDGINRFDRKLVNADMIQAALQEAWGGPYIVGDKMPSYVFDLGRLVRHRDLTCVMMYRDVRDVAASVLRAIKIMWSRKVFARELNSVRKVARGWLQAMNMINRFRSDILLIRYEDLIQDPQRELGRLAERIGVDPGGFSVNSVDALNAGKHRELLTGRQIALLRKWTAPVLEDFGYAV